MSKRLQLRLLVIFCIAVALVNGLKWYLTIPAQPPLTHFSGSVHTLHETHIPGQAWTFRLSGMDCEFYIADMMLGYGRVRRELERGEILHFWVNHAEYENSLAKGRPRAEVWKITRNDQVVLADSDVLASKHIGSTWRIVAVVLSFLLATGARVKLFLIRRGQMFDRMRRPGKPRLEANPAEARVSGRTKIRN